LLFWLRRRSIVYIDSFGTALPNRINVRDACTDPAPDCSATACGRPQTQLVTILNGGFHYIEVVTRSTGGTVGLNVQHVRIPNGGGLTGPIPTPPGAFSLPVTSTQGERPGPATCATATSPTRYYTWLSCPDTPAGTFSATTCNAATNFDTILQLRQGAHTDALCNNDANCAVSSLHSRISGPVAAGAELRVLMVNGVDGAVGSFGLTGSHP
jgi:hypothetical protein